MEKKIFQDVIVTINSKFGKKTMWLEEHSENGILIKYKICKNIQYKDFPEINVSSDNKEIKN